MKTATKKQKTVVPEVSVNTKEVFHYVPVTPVSIRRIVTRFSM